MIFLLDLSASRELTRRIRCTHSQGILSHLPCTHSPRTHSPHSHSPHVGRLYLGADDSPLSGACRSCGLHLQRLPDPAPAVSFPFPPPSLFFSSFGLALILRKRLTSVLSINAAISAAVVLASRLHDDLAVFALMLFSVEAFALFPILRRRLQVRLIPFAETSAHD